MAVDPPPTPRGGTGGGSPHQVGEGDVEDPRDAYQRGDLDLLAVLGALVRPSGEAGGHPYLVLGEVLAQAFSADALADGPAAFG